MARLHHVAITVNEFDKYVELFETLGMKIQKTRGTAPNRQLWFEEGIQLNEVPDEERSGRIDHIALGTEDTSALMQTAIDIGCSRVPGKERWFTFPNNIRVELMPVDNEDLCSIARIIGAGD